MLRNYYADYGERRIGLIKIGFVLSTNKNNYKPFRNQPLVALYLLTIIENYYKDKVDVSLIDLRGLDEEHIIYHIPEKDIYLYSIATPDYPEYLTILNQIRQTYHNAKHIAGGAHVNIFPKEAQRMFDSIILKEGEESIIQAINDILNSRLKKVYNQGGKIDLNAYPYPNRKYLPKKAVADEGLLSGKYLNLRGSEVLFSRGCPFDCHFCANQELMPGPVRYRSPENIVQEIEYLKAEYQIEVLAIKDDNAIPLNKHIAKQNLEAIKKTGIKWRGQSRANGISEDIVELAFESGCTNIAIGIESASQDVLNRINKKINLEEAKKYISSLKKTGIGVREHFIIGLPGETKDIVKQTLKFVDETNPSSVLLSLLSPLPGSKLFDCKEEFAIEIETTDWEKYRQAFGRFDSNEYPTMIFYYKEGFGMDKETILNNYIELQTIFRKRGLNF